MAEATNATQNQTETSTDIFAFEAVLFDLDGVITPTAEIHEKAWADMFRHYFEEKGVRAYEDADYYTYLDGRRRDEAIDAILKSRGIELPHGEASDTADDETIIGLGERKNNDFLARVEAGVDAYAGSVQLLDRLAMAALNPDNEDSGMKNAMKLAVVSSSKNARPVLIAAGLVDRFPVIVDGVVAQERGLPGKPAPDTFIAASEELGVAPERAVVVEDAISGVQAAAAGNFGLIIGVDRGAGEEELRKAGAHVVVSDLAELL